MFVVFKESEHCKNPSLLYVTYAKVITEIPSLYLLYLYQTNRESFKIITKRSKTRKHQKLLTAREDQTATCKMRSLYLSNASPILISENTS